MAELKTKQNRKSVPAFLNAIEDSGRRKDAKAIVKLMRDVTGERPMMWGDSVVGFGTYHYKYASGREGDWFVMGLAPGKTNLSLHLTCDLSGLAQLLAKLGKHKTGRSCLYIKRLEDVDQDVLRKLVEHTAAAARSGLDKQW